MRFDPDSVVDPTKAAQGLISIHVRVTQHLTGRTATYDGDHSDVDAFCRYRDVFGDIGRQLLYTKLGGRQES